MRKIASNLLWQDSRLERDPLLTLDDEGRILSLDHRPAPDREPFTEFYSGCMVLSFPGDYRTVFDLMMGEEAPLDELLRRHVVPPGEGIPAIISGIDYDTMRLTPRSAIRPLIKV